METVPPSAMVSISLGKTSDLGRGWLVSLARGLVSLVILVTLVTLLHLRKDLSTSCLRINRPQLVQVSEAQRPSGPEGGHYSDLRRGQNGISKIVPPSLALQDPYIHLQKVLDS